MDLPRNLLGPPIEEAIVMDEAGDGDDMGGGRGESRGLGRSPVAKTRSLSDSGGTPSKPSPSPFALEASRRMSKDDSNLRDLQPPMTPQQPSFNPGNLHLQMTPRDFTPPPAANSSGTKPAPLSPKLDHSQIYASPTNILPRRSRGLDFSRAATSLHHSTLAEQSSPDSSPTVGGGRAMNIPGRAQYGRAEQSSSSLWSIMGNQERMNVSSSLGSTAQAVGSDSSSSSDDDDLMDEDMEDNYVMTPQVSKSGPPMGIPPPTGPFGSPAMSSLISFQQRQRSRKVQKKKGRGPFGLGFSTTTASLSKSPPTSGVHSRRESISWQANQLHISGADVEDSARIVSDADGSNGDGQRSVVRRPVTRRGNLLPKTKTFARIRAALAEEGAPAEAEFRREAEVVKQVRESDSLEPRPAHTGEEPSAATTALSSPNLNANQEPLDDVREEDMMGDLATGLSSSFKQHAVKNSKGKTFWDTFSESGSVNGTRTTPPPPAFLPRGSSSGVSEDISMDSPSLSGPNGNSGGMPSLSRAESLRSDTPQALQNKDAVPPTAAEITRRFNSKRRRDDDLDPVSFKRRAVSPGMSVQNSPIMQSPLQRDSMPWGSRPGSNGGEKGGSSAPSDSGSIGGTPGNPSAGAGGRVNNKPRVGFQGMVDTNDGIMRMSIE